jgi:polyribonucleotide nucleotidyltransferase
MILVTAVSARTAKEGLDFFPLTVEYRESSYSAGRIPGNYFRREGRPNEKEVLTCRLIDRPVRPLFPEGYRFETQIVGSVISADARTTRTLSPLRAHRARCIFQIFRLKSDCRRARRFD